MCAFVTLNKRLLTYLLTYFYLLTRYGALSASLRRGNSASHTLTRHPLHEGGERVVS